MTKTKMVHRNLDIIVLDMFAQTEMIAVRQIMTNLNLEIIVLDMFRFNDVLPYDIVFLSI
jgi:hypothetical protein